MRQVFALRWQRWSALGGIVGQDSPTDMTLSLRVFVVHVVAGLAVIAITCVASREDVLGAAQGAFTDVHLARGFLGLRSGRELDDLVIGVTTVPGERRRWGLRGCWRSALLLFRFPLLLLRLLSKKRACTVCAD
jgi:hypothetical protein